MQMYAENKLKYACICTNICNDMHKYAYNMLKYAQNMQIYALNMPTYAWICEKDMQEYA